MPISLFLMSAAFIAWLGFVIGMMIRGVDPTFAGEAVSWVIALPLMVLPAFNFSPAIQIHLALSPASKYFVYGMFMGAGALSALWAIGTLDGAYAFVFFSLWVQLVLLRFLMNRYFRVMGIYPGDVVFYDLGVSISENMKLPMKNRLYATALFFTGMAQLMLLVLFL